MTLTPTIKFLIIALAFTFALASEFWFEAESDLIDGVGLSEPLYSIVNRVLGKLDLAMSGLLVYLGLKAPTTGEKVVPE